MWAVSILPPRSRDEKLASLSVECPRNMRTEDEFGLLVALWCGKVWNCIEADGIRHQFCFGFFAGEVVVETSAGRISNQGRLEVEAGRVKITAKETGESKTDTSVGGQIGFELPKWFGLGKGAADVGGHLNHTVSKIEQKDGEQYHIFWRVADAGINFWRVCGFGLNKENVLENKIIGDEPLCRIAGDREETIQVTVSFRCDLRDLWFQRASQATGPRDVRFDKEQDERNRAAVAGRVIAVALNRRAAAIDDGADFGTVILAKQKLKSVRTSRICGDPADGR